MKFLPVIVVCVMLASADSFAAKLTVKLGNSTGVTLVGAIQRWDEDGNHRKLPDPNAKIDSPAVDARAMDEGNGRWTFPKLSPGTYDLVIMADGLRRYEGFQFVPVREFDPFIPADKKPDEESLEFILDHIKKSQQYENKVEPLYWAGDKDGIRVLMMLLRDKPTTYEDIPNAATLRHEVWQYSWKYGGWQKEKRTKVLDRVIMDRNQLRRWTWLWDPKLGGIQVKEQKKPLEIHYNLPKPGEKNLKGLYPY